MSATDGERRARADVETVDSELVEYLETRAETDLRCVVEYDEAGWDTLYARDDVQREAYQRLSEEMERRVRAAAARESDSAVDAGPRIAVRSTTCYETGPSYTFTAAVRGASPSC